MKDFESVIETLTELGSQKLMEASFNIVQYAELLEAVCNQYGRQRVMEAIEANRRKD